MHPFIEIKSSRLAIAPEQVLLRSADYQHYLTANEFVDLAQKRAQDIERGAQAIHARQKELGWEAGMEQARLQQAALVQETLVKCDHYYRRVAQQMSEVVLQAVRKILQQYDDVELTLQVTREALLLVSNQKKVILHVQPERVGEVRERISLVLKDFPEIGYVEVIADTRLGHGGCLLETDIGIIDASVEGQLMVLESAFKSEWVQAHQIALTETQKVPLVREIDGMAPNSEKLK